MGKETDYVYFTAEVSGAVDSIDVPKERTKPALKLKGGPYFPSVIVEEKGFRNNF